MTTITKECECEYCTNEISFGIETRYDLRPKYCSTECRDVDQNRIGAPPRSSSKHPANRQEA